MTQFYALQNGFCSGTACITNDYADETGGPSHKQVSSLRSEFPQAETLRRGNPFSLFFASLQNKNAYHFQVRTFYIGERTCLQASSSNVSGHSPVTRCPAGASPPSSSCVPGHCPVPAKKNARFSPHVLSRCAFRITSYFAISYPNWLRKLFSTSSTTVPSLYAIPFSVA